MKKLVTLLLAVFLALGFVACGNGEEPAGTVGGTVKCNGAGLAGVSLMVGEEAKATTAEDGTYSLGDFTGEVTIKPVKEGYTFLPETLTVTFARPDADFTATPVATGGTETGGETEEPETPVEPADKTRIPAPTDGSLYDDFADGLSPDGKWDIVNKKWGDDSFNGTTASNVNYTQDGILVLSSKGMYWENASERNTGAAIVTKEALGPGRFEVAAKISPRQGMCTAFWTYYYESEECNHEIDIEFPGKLNGRIGYDSVMNTNWTNTGAGHTTETVPLSDKGLSAQNDGKWHTYAFEWSVKNNTIKYYIDDVLTYTSTTNIPTYEGQFWIGVWQPVEWAGVPEYETSDLLVDWVAYTPYNETADDGVQEAKEEYLENSVAGERSFPTEPVVLDENGVEIVSNGDFSGIASAWALTEGADPRSGITATDYTASNYVYRLIGQSEAVQTITAVYEGFEYTLDGLAKISRGGVDLKAEFAVEFLDKEGDVIGEAETFAVEAGEDFAAFKGTVTAPEGSVAMRLVLRSQGDKDAVVLFDSVSMHRVIDLVGEVA